MSGNLPLQLTSFVGREREIEEHTRLLWTTRLLTLTGAGGSGKTRLALRVADGVGNRFGDGIWLVELAPVSDAAFVAQAAAALDLRSTPRRPVMDALAHELRVRSLLLVLDNCEHLIGDRAGGGARARLLRGADRGAAG